MRNGTLRLLRLREQAEAVAEDMSIERGRFERLADREPVRVVSSFNLFQTPEPLAARMAERLAPSDDARILEPSAGLGRLYRAVRDRSGGHVTLVEQSAECCGELYRSIAGDNAARLVQADFLAQSEKSIGLFDAVIMNPPFKNGRDIKHVKHALTLLSHGGRLVALVANGPRQQKLQEIATAWEIIPRGTFDGTRVETVMVTIDA